MSKSAIYTNNSSTQSLSVGNIINLGQTVRRFGSNLFLNGNGINISGGGYYDVDANITFEGTAAGTVTISLYKDGVAVNGANATVTTADATTYNVSLSALVRQMGCNCVADSILTLVVSGLAIDVTNVSVVVEKE